MKYKILLLLVIVLISVSASFAFLESDVNDNQNSINTVGEVNNTYSDKEIGEIKEQQRDWYCRNYEKIGLYEYLKDHDYMDGASIDLPEDPFPHKGTDFRIIAFSERGSTVYLESLSTFLDPVYQKAWKNGGVYDDGSVMGVVALLFNVGNNNNTNNSSDDLADFYNLVEDANSSIINSNPNNVDDTHIVSAGMERTGLPVVALILATLMSIFIYRRKE